MTLAHGLLLRQAYRGDIPAMQRIRREVRENRLVSTVIADEDVREYIEDRGRGWVVEDGTDLIAFAIADASTGSIWALFVGPSHERRGCGRALLDTMVEWLRASGVATIWLTTAPRTRAEAFYRAAGWTDAGVTASGERRFERQL
jgi:GNAT superfamily N-acetyltransferase